MNKYWINLVAAALLWAAPWGQARAQGPQAKNSSGESESIDHYVKAETFRRNKRYIEAIDEYEKAMASDPQNFKFPYSRGVCYYMLKDAANAISSLQKSVLLKPDYVASHTLIAQCFRTQKKYDDVVKSLDLAFKYETDNNKKAAYKMDIIVTLLRNKEFAKAKPHIAQAKTIIPSDPNLLFYEGKVANQLNDFATAKASLSQGIKLLTTSDPKITARYHYELGMALYRLGEFEKAFESWKSADVGPFKPMIARYNPRVYFANAMCYMKIYDYAKARENLDIAVKMQRNYTQAYMLLADIAKKEAKYDAAVTVYQQAVAIETDPARQSEINKAMAYALMDSQRFGEAINAAAQSLKNNPGDYQLLFLKAMANYRLKNFTEAVKDLEGILGNPALDIDSRAMVHFALGVIFKLQNQTEKAKMAFKKADAGSFSKTAQMELAALDGLDTDILDQELPAPVENPPLELGGGM